MDTSDKRPFGFWTATALIVGGMIGSGIFTLPAQLAPYGWTSVAAWVIAIGGALIISQVLVRLAQIFPGETGIVAICARELGPLPGVLVGWSYWVSVWAANAYISITAIRYLGVFWPPLTATPAAMVISSIALIWLITLLNLAGARTAGRFQVATTILKLLPLAAVVVLIAGLAFAGGHQFSVNPHPALAWGGVTGAIPPVFFAIVGFECASVAAERVRDPAKNVRRATYTGLLMTGLLYIIICTGVIMAMPQATIAAAQAPIALFVETFWGHGAALGVAAFTAIAAIGALNGWVLIQGEVPLGMARAGVLPAWFGRTDRRDVPVGVLALASIAASVLILSNISTTAAIFYDFMLRLTAAANLWLYIGACFAALKRRTAIPAAIVGAAFCLWAIWGSGWQAAGLSIALMLTAIPLYLLRPKTRLAEQPA